MTIKVRQNIHPSLSPSTYYEKIGKIRIAYLKWKIQLHVVVGQTR